MLRTDERCMRATPGDSERAKCTMESDLRAANLACVATWSAPEQSQPAETSCRFENVFVCPLCNVLCTSQIAESLRGEHSYFSRPSLFACIILKELAFFVSCKMHTSGCSPAARASPAPRPKKLLTPGSAIIAHQRCMNLSTLVILHCS